MASTAAGNAGVPVVVDGFYYGKASGMAPRARYAFSVVELGSFIYVYQTFDRANYTSQG